MCIFCRRKIKPNNFLKQNWSRYLLSKDLKSQTLICFVLFVCLFVNFSCVCVFVKFSFVCVFVCLLYHFFVRRYRRSRGRRHHFCGGREEELVVRDPATAAQVSGVQLRQGPFQTFRQNSHRKHNRHFFAGDLKTFFSRKSKYSFFFSWQNRAQKYENRLLRCKNVYRHAPQYKSEVSGLFINIARFKN